MQGVAAPWLVLQLTGSGVALGIDTALQFLPILLIGAWGGVIADRFDNRRVLVWTQIAFAIPAFALWILDATGVVQVWMVYLLSFLSGLATAIDMPTRQSFYLEMVGPRRPHERHEPHHGDVHRHADDRPGARRRADPLRWERRPSSSSTASRTWRSSSRCWPCGSPSCTRARGRRARRGRSARASATCGRRPTLRLPMLTMAAVFLFAFNFTVLIPLLAVRDLGGGAGTFGVLLGDVRHRVARGVAVHGRARDAAEPAPALHPGGRARGRVVRARLRAEPRGRRRASSPRSGSRASRSPSPGTRRSSSRPRPTAGGVSCRCTR